MANSEQLATLKNGVIAWNEWRRATGVTWPDLRGADLSRHGLLHTELIQRRLKAMAEPTLRVREAGAAADLRGVNFSQTDLRYTNLAMADLTGADLSGARMSFAILVRARLDRANVSAAVLHLTQLTNASAQGTDLRAADLSYANLAGVDLKDADFSNAVMVGCGLNDLDLSDAKGLEEVTHIGPSSIGVDTIVRSRGRIPRAFLEGAGLPDQLIDYAKSFGNLEWSSCFISHSAADQPFVDRLYADLQSNGVRAWCFKYDATLGESVWAEIEHGIESNDRLIVVCSRESLRSGPVLREIERALYREDEEGRSVLFPIKIDDYLFAGWQHERRVDVLRKVVGDFTRWDENDGRYTESLQRLLGALRLPRPARS